MCDVTSCSLLSLCSWGDQWKTWLAAAVWGGLPENWAALKIFRCRGLLFFCLCFLSAVKIAAAKNGQTSVESCVFDAALDLLPFGIFICNIMTHKCFKCITFPFPFFFSGAPSKTTCVTGWACLTPPVTSQTIASNLRSKANMLKRMPEKPVMSAKKCKTGDFARNKNLSSFWTTSVSQVMCCFVKFCQRDY